MVARRDEQFKTVDDYLALIRQSDDVKYEYGDGRVYAMAGGTLDHSAIGRNVVAALDALLENSPCRVYNSDARVRLSATRWVLPDATVTCDERDQGSVEEITAPLVVVEVLSESTEAHDRGRKSRWYRACHAVQEYVLIATESRQVEVYRRHHDADIWELATYGPEDTVALRSLSLSIPVARIYRGTTIVAGNDAGETAPTDN